MTGRFPHSPNAPKVLRVSVQYGCDVSRNLVESLIQQQRMGQPVQLIKLLGKTDSKPNILPHDVAFDTLDSGACDHVTDVLVLLRGPLAKQFNVASAALQAGKQLLVLDARLMQAYGDILTKMAAAYHTSIGTMGLLAGQGVLAQTLTQLAPFGVQEILHYVEDARNAHIEVQERTEATLQAPEAFAPLLDNVAFTVQGMLAQKWTRPVQPQLPLPSPHTQRVAARMGGALRFLARVTAGGADVSLHFVPTHSTILQETNTTVITMKDGSRQTLHADVQEDCADSQARALLCDVLTLTQNPRRTVLSLSRPQEEVHVRQSLLFTTTAIWREAKENFAHQIVSEQLVGTTLAVTVRHHAPLVLSADVGTVCALPHTINMQQHMPSLRVAN